jgi:Protein of unknown function (DUF541)
MPIHESLPAAAARRLGALLLVASVAVSASACTSSVSPSSAASHGAPIAGGATAVGAPVAGKDGQAVLPAPTSAGGGAAAGTAGTTGGVVSSGIAYPYPIYGGSPGVAPDHSILVTGTGQAELKSDGSNRATAERTALSAAVADAKNRADDVAAATHVTIQGILSVSVSVGQAWISPVAIESPGGPAVPPTSGSVRAPAPAVPAAPQLQVTVTVAYTIG